MGEKFVRELEYRLNLHNLGQLAIEDGAKKNSSLFDLIKAQTYVASEHVPDDWLQEDIDHGPVNMDVLRTINPSKETFAVYDSYESLQKRLKKKRPTAPHQ